MDKLNKFWPIILGVAVIIIVLILFQFLRIHLEAPDFASIKDVTERKETFLTYFDRSIRKLNNAVAGDREKIELLASSRDFSGGRLDWLKSKAAQYEVAGDFSPAFFDRLLSRVDVLPPALILAQTALESGWGTSRYAVEGNNFFGQKCFQEDCGIAPTDPAPGQKFEFMPFETPFDSVNAYMFNLNTHDAYAQLRAIRARMKKNGEPVTGYGLAEGLAHYSESGQGYVREIRNIIRSNHLDETYPVNKKNPGS